MKTRRILAASTAALLCSTAVAVISTSASAETVTSVSVTNNGSNQQTTATIASTTNSLTVNVDCSSLTAKNDTEPDAANQVKGTSNTLALTVDTSGVSAGSSGNVTVTYQISAAKSNDPASYEWKTITVTIAVTKEAAQSSESESSSSSSSAAPTDIEYDKDWTAINTPAAGEPTVEYKVTSANAGKLKGLTITANIGATQANLTSSGHAVYGGSGDLKDLKDSQKTKLQSAAANGAILININVAKEDEDDYGDREKFTVPAPISINVTDLGFEANHVYHYEDKKLVELKVDKLTDKNASGTTKYGIQFTTKSFSPFIITKDVVKGAVALDDEENPANASGTTSNAGTSSSNPNTGIALAIAPVVLAAGAVAVVALKKKH